MVRFLIVVYTATVPLILLWQVMNTDAEITRAYQVRFVVSSFQDLLVLIRGACFVLTVAGLPEGRVWDSMGTHSTG